VTRDFSSAKIVSCATTMVHLSYELFLIIIKNSSVLECQEVLVDKFCREHDMKRANLVNEVVNFLSGKVEDGGRERFEQCESYFLQIKSIFYF
jgi:hypothetical protein